MANIMNNVHEHTDPDAQATVTDFIDYTEYLPSDLERALTLIGKLDQTYDDAKESLHELLKRYCKLPQGNDEQASIIEAEDLRAKISNRLNLAIHVREAAYVEATRLHENMLRHKGRLQSIHTKLLVLPKPPSRDPTPQPTPSPTLSRRGLSDGQRLRLKTDGARLHMKKLGGRPRPRVIVPGDVLPPRNPDSPTASMYDDFTSSDSSSEDEPPKRLLSHKKPKTPKPPKIPKMKLPKIPREKKERPPRPPRPHGVMGTNVHSAVAGISTSNALMLLDPPPPNAQVGSEHAPWMRLTEWEMAKLRKRMKKNAIWAPSDTMIRRELADSGRGPDAYYRAKTLAEETGEDFIDFDDLVNRDKSEPLRPGEIPLDSKAKLLNKGMSLNVQKKKKRDLEAQQAKDLEHANATLSGLGNKMSTIFSKPKSVDERSTVAEGEIVLKNKKRKRDAEDGESATEESKANAQLHSEIILASKPARKAAKTDQPKPEKPEVITTTRTTTVPLAAPAPSPKKVIAPAPPATSPTTGRKAKNVSIKEIAVPILTSRPPSRQASNKPAATPDTSREHLRRKSATPAPQTPLTASRLRNRKQAPGTVTNAPDGGAAVSIGKRKNAPRKKGAAANKKDAVVAAVKADENSLVTDEEAIDPNEETYCICGGVSFGTMILCENPDCEKEWFHLDCVGLKEPPARRSKWWCPECRVKLGLDG